MALQPVLPSAGGSGCAYWDGDEVLSRHGMLASDAAAAFSLPMDHAAEQVRRGAVSPWSTYTRAVCTQLSRK